MVYLLCKNIEIKIRKEGTGLKNVKRLLATFMVGIVGFSTIGCSMIEKTPEAIRNTALAKVNGEKITKGDVDQELKSYIDQFKQTYGEDFEKEASVKAQLDEYRKQVTNTLIDERVLLTKAKDMNLVPSEEEIKKEFDEKVAELVKAYGSEEAFEKAKKDYGYTEESFKKFMENQIIAQKTIDSIYKDINVSDEDIKKKYDETIDSYKKKPGATMYHIIVDSEDKARQVKSRLDNGEDYAKLAEEFNTDSTKNTGGSLGYVEYSNENYDKDFMAAAKELKEGEISGPVKSAFGYHIIKVDGVQNEEYTQSFDEVKDSIKSSLETEKKNEAYEAKLEEWKKELDVKTYFNKL